MKYAIFTKKSGYVFYICHTEAKGYFVSSSAPDHEVLLTDKETAQSIADENSNENTKYEIKPVEVVNGKIV